MFNAKAKRLGVMAVAAVVAATGVQALVAAPAQAFSSSGLGTTVVQNAAPYAVSTNASEAEVMVLNQINAYRVQNGRNAIQLDGGFTKGAREWAQHLVDTGKPAGHPDQGFFFENVAYTLSPERAVGLWRNSAGHDRNMLESSITHGGVGIVERHDGTYAVVFRGLWEPAGAENSKGHPNW